MGKKDLQLSLVSIGSVYFFILSAVFFVPVLFAQQEIAATPSSQEITQETKPEAITQATQSTIQVNPQNAQEISAQAVQEVLFVFEKDELKEDIAEVKRTLNGQLAEYRQSEQDFRILQGQYFQLNTLSSLEAAIQGTRSVQEKRNQVLGTYLALLTLELNNTAGIKLEYREYVITEIEALELALLRHTDQVRTSLDRVAIAKASSDFELTGQKVQQTIAFARSVLQLARYQALFDSTVSVLENIRTDDAETSEYLTTPQDERAFEQIITVMESIEANLLEADTQVLKVITPMERGRATSVSFDKVLSSNYGNFTQVYRYLDELLGNF